MRTIDHVPDAPSVGFEERHFTICQLAKMWNLSEELVRQLVRDEPGVTEWVRQAPGKRRYRVLRIPQSVVDRLYRQAQERGNPETLVQVTQRRSR